MLKLPDQQGGSFEKYRLLTLSSGITEYPYIYTGILPLAIYFPVPFTGTVRAMKDELTTAIVYTKTSLLSPLRIQRVEKVI